MEGLARRVYALAGLIMIGGLSARIASPAANSLHDEKWMEHQSLKGFAKFKMLPGDGSDPEVSYKMDPTTYRELVPNGIVCRELSNGSSTYDVVLIASQAKGSFHDPRVCFTAQGWQLDQLSEANVKTKSRGNVPVTVAQIRSEQNGTRWAAFCYRGPYNFSAGVADLKLQMFKYSLVNSRNSDGVFYRFIGQSNDVNRASLLKFIGEYLDASSKYGTGYF